MSESWRGCILRYCTNGVADQELEEQLGKQLKAAYLRGKKERDK